MCKPNRHPLGDHVCCFVYNCGIKHLEMWKNIKKQSIKQGKTLKKQIMYNIKIENHILDDEFGFFFIIKQIKFNRLLFFLTYQIFIRVIWFNWRKMFINHKVQQLSKNQQENKDHVTSYSIFSALGGYRRTDIMITWPDSPQQIYLSTFRQNF